MSLWEDVVEGYTGDSSFSNNLDAATEADIDARITDDGFTVAEYTGECFTAMVACEAAMNAIEGRCAVEYLKATDESARARVASAMEASISGAWAKIKEYAERAWEAVKKFIKKVWQKIKGYAAVIRNAFTKFKKSIDKSKLGDLQVKWQKIAPENVARVLEQDLKNIENQIKSDTKDSTKLNLDYQEAFLKGVTVAIYGNENGYEPKPTSAASVVDEAIKIADQNYDKYFQGFIRLGDTKQKDLTKIYRSKLNDARDADSEADGKDVKAAAARRFAQVEFSLIQKATNILKVSIQQKYSMAVKACRAMVRYSHGDKTATAKESYTNFEQVLGQIL